MSGRDAPGGTPSVTPPPVGAMPVADPYLTPGGLYAVALDGPAVSALVVGGGAAAERKVLGLLQAGVRVRAVARFPTATLKAWAANPRFSLSLSERDYAADDVADALFVVAAAESRELNARVAADARARQRLVLVTDVPEEGNCATVAQYREGGLLVAVAADVAPGAATHVLHAVHQRFDGRYGDALAALRALRQRVTVEGGPAAWRRALEELVRDDFCREVESGALARRAGQWR